MSAARRRPGARWLVGACLVAVALVCVGAAFRGTLVYSRDPGQVVRTHVPAGQQVRVSGTVVPGTLVEQDGGATFTLEGGGSRLPVHAQEAPKGSFREGQQAVVEGTLATDGTLTATSVMTKHDNTYKAKPSAARTPAGGP